MTFEPQWVAMYDIVLKGLNHVIKSRQTGEPGAGWHSGKGSCSAERRLVSRARTRLLIDRERHFGWHFAFPEPPVVETSPVSQSGGGRLFPAPACDSVLAPSGFTAGLAEGRMIKSN